MPIEEKQTECPITKLEFRQYANPNVTNDQASVLNQTEDQVGIPLLNSTNTREIDSPNNDTNISSSSLNETESHNLNQSVTQN